jgi:uncharacterized protein (DUF111 family)
MSHANGDQVLTVGDYELVDSRPADHHEMYMDAMLEAGVNPNLIGNVLDRVITQEANVKIENYTRQWKSRAAYRVEKMKYEIINRTPRVYAK